MTYWITVATLALVYGSLALSYNMAVGYVGMLSMTHAAFFGIGAYSYALLGTSAATGAVFLPALMVGFGLAAGGGLLLGTLIMWLPREYVVLVTFSVQLIMTALMVTMTGLTGGPVGVPAVPFPEIGGWVVDNVEEGLVLATALVLLTLVVSVVAARYPLGLSARMVRDDPVAAEGLGVSTKKVSILFFSLSAGLAGVAGGVFAGIVLYVDPTSFTLETSILVLSMIAIGGLGNPYGVLLGGVVISFLPQLLRQLDLASGSAASLQQIIYGLALIVIMIVRPVGLLREQPVVRIGERAA